MASLVYGREISVAVLDRKVPNNYDFNSFGMESVYRQSRNKIFMNSVDAWRENSEFIVRRLLRPHNLKFDQFTSLSGQRNVQKCKMQVRGVQSYYGA